MDPRQSFRVRCIELLTAIFVCATGIDAGAAEPAPPSRSAVTEARTYFNVGAKAYAAGKYLPAIRAFEEAYRRAPRPGLLFSIAQAYRRQYFIDKNPEHVRSALKYYRDYLSQEPDGPRRVDTAEALTELEPIAERLGARDPDAAPVAAPPKPSTQLMVSSATDGVEIELDGRPAGKLPFVSDVSPGMHRIVLHAPGFETYTREVRVLEGSVVPLDAALVEKPANVSLRAPEGADVSIDGRPRGTTPLAPLRVSSGRHVVSVIKNGREPFATEIEVAPGKKYDIDVDLETTSQRVASYALFATAGAGVLASGALFALALKREGDAQDIADQRDHGISVADAGKYRDAVEDRDTFRTAGAVALGIGVAAGAVGLVLYSFDRPTTVAPGRLRERGGPGPEQKKPGALEVSAAVTSFESAFVTVSGSL